MKIIFLDIDGVLNCLGCQEKIQGCIFVEEKKIFLLKELVDKTGAEIVLSSTWRYGWECRDNIENPSPSQLQDIRLFEALEERLAFCGIKLRGYTDDFGPRGKEIDAWLKAHFEENIESYVILDDMDAEELQPHSHRLVQTSIFYGLEAKHIRKATKILNCI